MDKIDRVKDNRRIIEDAVRHTFGMDTADTVFTINTSAPTSKARFDDTGQCKDTIGEQDIPHSEFHGIAMITAIIPHHVFDEYGAKEERFEGGAVASFLNALGPRKTGRVECVITDFEGRDVPVEFPVMISRGRTPEEQAEMKALHSRIGLFGAR